MKPISEERDVKITHPLILGPIFSLILYQYGFLFLNKIIFIKASYDQLSIFNIIGTLLAIISNHLFINKLSDYKWFRSLLVIEFLLYTTTFLIIYHLDSIEYYLLMDGIIFNTLTNGISVHSKRLINDTFILKARFRYDMIIKQVGSISSLIALVLVLFIKPNLLVTCIICCVAISIDNVFYFYAFSRFKNNTLKESDVA